MSQPNGHAATGFYAGPKHYLIYALTVVEDWKDVPKLVAVAKSKATQEGHGHRLTNLNPRTAQVKLADIRRRDFGGKAYGRDEMIALWKQREHLGLKPATKDRRSAATRPAPADTAPPRPAPTPDLYTPEEIRYALAIIRELPVGVNARRVGQLIAQIAEAL